MPGNIKDTEYLYASSRIRALEGLLLTKERLERMIGAQSDSEALRVLSECGYPDVPDGGSLEGCLARARRDAYGLVARIVPDAPIVDAFRVRHDYHNLKTLVKSEAAGADPARLLSDCGRVGLSALTDIYLRRAWRELPETMGRAAAKARDVLAETADAQLSDFVLDRACYKEMLDTARLSGSVFLTGYVRLLIDAANLRGFVRSARTGRGRTLGEALIPGGDVAPERLMDAQREGTPISALYGSSLLYPAAAEGESAVSGGASLSPFERLVEGAVIAYLKKARTAPFGEQPVVAYLAAREAEMANVRTVMAGRFSGAPPEAIRERLRDAYV